MARTVVKVVGMADRSIGTSKKTGLAYDFCEVAFTFVNRWQQNAVAVAALDGSVLDKFDVHVGDQFDAIVNTFNNKTYVDLIDQVY